MSSPIVSDPRGTRIASDRLVLEPICTEHAALLFEGLQDDRIYAWIGSEPPASPERLCERWIAVEMANRLGPAIGLNWALRRTCDGEYIGKLDAELDRRIATNVGYLLFPDYWKHGYASEALAALVAHLAQHGVDEFHAYVTLGNVASERVLRRAGFERGGVLIGRERIRGVVCDDVEYVRRIGRGQIEHGHGHGHVFRSRTFF